MEHKGLIIHQLCIPNLDIKAFLSTVQRVWTIVNRQVIFLAMKLKSPVSNTVTVSSYQST